MSALASSSTSLYSMRRLQFPSGPTAAAETPAIRRLFAASMSAMASPPRGNKRLSSRSSNQGQLGTPMKAAAASAAAAGRAGTSVVAASALPSHCSGCGVSLQASDPDFPG